MENQVEGMTGATEVNSNPAPTATQEVSQPSVSASPASAPEGAPAVTPEAEYQPNWKFKVLDKEHEFDELLRPLVKSKEHEAKIRELYEKAYGLDHVKTERESVRNEFKTFKTQAEPILRDVAQATRFYQTALQKAQEGDQVSAYNQMQKFVQHLGLNKNALRQFVFHDLQMEDLPQAQKMEYTRRQELENQAMSAQERVTQLEQQFQTVAVQQRTAELNQAISKPEVASIAQAFDQRNGPGSFKNEIIRRGQMYHFAEKRDVPADDIVNEMVKLFGNIAPQASAPSQAAVSPQGPVPVIPVVKGGGNSSPTHRNIESLDDLKKIRQQKFGY